MARKKKFISQEYSAGSGGKNLKEGTRKSKTLSAFTAAIFSVAIIISASMIAFTVIFFFSEVTGSSMMATINPNYILMNNVKDNPTDTDSVVVNRYLKPEIGNIIIVEHHNAQGVFVEFHIKRVIALGGDSLHFELSSDGTKYTIYVNGTVYENNKYMLSPDYGEIPNAVGNYYYNFYEYQEGRRVSPNSLFRMYWLDGNGEQVPFRQYDEEREQWEIKLPKGYVFYMGDNRMGKSLQPRSVDCTYYGPQPASHIVGTVVDIMQYKSAPRWFWEKIVWFVTLRWIF
jgi:signal peptidase I